MRSGSCIICTGSPIGRDCINVHVSAKATLHEVLLDSLSFSLVCWYHCEPCLFIFLLHGLMAFMLYIFLSFQSLCGFSIAFQRTQKLLLPYPSHVGDCMHRVNPYCKVNPYRSM